MHEFHYFNLMMQFHEKYCYATLSDERAVTDIRTQFKLYKLSCGNELIKAFKIHEEICLSDTAWRYIISLQQ